MFRRQVERVRADAEDPAVAGGRVEDEGGATEKEIFLSFEKIRCHM